MIRRQRMQGRSAAADSLGPPLTVSSSDHVNIFSWLWPRNSELRTPPVRQAQQSSKATFYTQHKIANSFLILDLCDPTVHGAALVIRNLNIISERVRNRRLYPTLTDWCSEEIVSGVSWLMMSCVGVMYQPYSNTSSNNYLPQPSTPSQSSGASPPTTSPSSASNVYIPDNAPAPLPLKREISEKVIKRFKPRHEHLASWWHRSTVWCRNLCHLVAINFEATERMRF